MRKDHFDLVIRYLSGTLGPEERVQFEQELGADRALQREFELHRDLIASLKAKQKARLKEELQGIWAQIKKEAPAMERNEGIRISDDEKKAEIDRLKKFAVKMAAGLAAAGLLLSQLSGTMRKDKKSDQNG